MLAGMNEELQLQNKVRRSRAEIETILSEFRESGLTQVAFARERGLNLATFRTWLAKNRGERVKGFCPVTVRGENNDALTIRLPGGIEISVCGGADPQWVIALARGLSQ